MNANRATASICILLAALTWQGHRNGVGAAEKIYSVKEIVGILNNSPKSLFEGKFRVKARYIRASQGILENDFATLMDLADAPLNVNRITYRKNAPCLMTGPSYSMPRDLLPTNYAIYEGHFADPRFLRWKDGARRFVIDRKIVELKADGSIADTSRYNDNYTREASDKILAEINVIDKEDTVQAFMRLNNKGEVVKVVPTANSKDPDVEDLIVDAIRRAQPFASLAPHLAASPYFEINVSWKEGACSVDMSHLDRQPPCLR
ncbi:MAG: hypothetical protein IPM23_23815 [Candidatus Melainabacteria bacterium]|nr:hypothetical protein [Candidatus Melainabacteria bacterium]